MAHIKTKSGLNLEIDESPANDQVLLDAFLQMQSGDAIKGLSTVVHRLLAPPSVKALYDHVRINGRVPCGALIKEVTAIMESLGPQRKIIILAGMLATDEDALVCDLAETYHIYDWRALPVRTVATLACGLSDDSRIKMKIRGSQTSTDRILTAAMIDRLSLLVWAQTKDAQKGRNRPEMLVDLLHADRHDNGEVVAFSSPEDFQAARNKIIGK